MRDADAAERDVIAGTEGVHVDAGAGAHVAERGEHVRLGAGEIAFGGDLDVAGLAGKYADLHAGPFGERGVVGEILAACAAARRCASSKASKAKPCGVCTRRNVVRSSVLADQASGIDGLDGVGDGQRRDRRAGFFGGRDRARNQAGAGEGPRRVVDQNDVGLAGGERLQPGAHRSLPGGAAEYRRKKVETNSLLAVEIDVVVGE